MSKLTNDQVADIVENEGLGYAVTCYMTSENIKNADLKNLWDHATEALNDLEKFLEENSYYEG